MQGTSLKSRLLRCAAGGTGLRCFNWDFLKGDMTARFQSDVAAPSLLFYLHLNKTFFSSVALALFREQPN